MPWIHLYVGNEGYVKACCVANITFGNVNTQSFDEIWNGEKIQTLRQKFLKGETDPRCQVCHNLEQRGEESIRQETHKKFANHTGPWTVENSARPVYFDIRFSNKCNFKCLTCWHGFSSSWFEEGKKKGAVAGNTAIIQNIKDYSGFIEQYGLSLLKAEEIYIAGGEPLIMDEHYELLEFLLRNKSTGMRLRYNTNFSKLQYKQYDVLEYWKQFENVEVLASIDAMGEEGERIRPGFNWNTFLENREKLRALPHVQFKIAPTVSTLNVHLITEMYNYCVKNDIIDEGGIYLNYLDRPKEFRVG
jgi:MoaA/NifB/PqqE/SkfB family radical SAM enzyme